MTLMHHISAVRAIISNGPASDDVSYSDRLIAHFLQIARAKLLEQKADKYRYISDQSFQSVCLDLELGTFHNCCDVEEIECHILKTTTKIPKLLNSRWGAFVKVMDLSGEIISEFNLTSKKYSQYAIAPVKIGWFMHDGYLYLVNNKKLEKVLLNGLFASTEDIAAINCPTPNSANCLDYGQQEFPIDPDLVDPMYKVTLEYLLQSERIPNDSENNSKSTEIVNGKQ